MPGVTVAVEGVADAAVLRKLLASRGFDVYATHGLQGKGHLDASLQGFNNAARFSPWLIVRDLDRDDTCGAALARTLLPEPARWMRLRIAVREIEAWLLADGDSLAAYLSVRRRLIPGDPDDLRDPKRTLVNLARQSRRRTIVTDIVPREGLSASVGPGYTARISEYAVRHWRPEVAALNSPSLRRCVDRLRELADYP